jgi:hypothetical protein
MGAKVFKFNLSDAPLPKDPNTLQIVLYDMVGRVGHLVGADKFFDEIEAELTRRLDTVVDEIQSEWREAIKDPNRPVVVMTDEPPD